MAAVAPEPTPENFAARIQAVQARLAASVARAGLKDDAYAHVIDAQSAVLGELAEFINEVRQARQPSAEFTDNQVEEIGKRMVRSCQEWAGSLVKAANIRSAAILLATLLVALCLGFGAGWFGRGAPPDLTCGPQRGGQVCWVWTVPPTEPEVATNAIPPQTKPTGGK